MIREDKLPIKYKFYCHKLFQGRGFFPTLNSLNWGGVCDISDHYIHLKVFFFSSQIFCILTMLKSLLNIQSLLMVHLHRVSFVIRGLVSFRLKEMTPMKAHLGRVLFRRQRIESAVCQIFSVSGQKSRSWAPVSSCLTMNTTISASLLPPERH